MKAEELTETNLPVLCADGKFGELLIFSSETGECGVQVHGEPLHRWIHVSELKGSKKGALRQEGAPRVIPPECQHDMVQQLLMLDWMGRGGPMIG